jgi:hypothetical protein
MFAYVRLCSLIARENFQMLENCGRIAELLENAETLKTEMLKSQSG